MVPEAVTVVTGFQGVAAMREPVKQRGGYPGVAKDSRSFGAAEISGDGYVGVLIEFANEVEQQSTPALALSRAWLKRLHLYFLMVAN